MKNFFKSLFKNLAVDAVVVILFFVGVVIYFFVAGPGSVSADSYTPLQPIEINGANAIDSSSIGSYINSIYTLSIGIGAVLAVLMLSLIHI